MILAVALVITAIAPSFAPIAQGAARVPTIAILGPTPNNPDNRHSFVEGLTQRGYAESQVAFVDRHADSVADRLPALATEVVRGKPDVIFARGPAAVAALARATTTIPIVAVDLESDPVALGFAKTLARPGGNVTGVFLDLPEMIAKQLQLLREIFPGLAKVALLGDFTSNAAQFRATERAAQSLGVQTQALEGRTPAQLEAGLEAARRNGVGAVIIFSSPVVFANSARLATLARERRLPTVSLFIAAAEAGGLLTYGPSLPEAFRRCGVYVAKIISGTKPGDLPIERPERFDLVINMKTAKALGVTMPPSLLARANQLIE